MVLRVIANVTDHGRPPGFADAECTVPALPGELALLGPPLTHPSRGVGFDDPHAISQGKVGRQACQQMNMIDCSANCDGNGIKFSEDSAEIGMNVETYCILKERRATRRGEDDVDEKAGIGMRHSYAPPGLRIHIPTLIPQACAWGYHLLPATRA